MNDSLSNGEYISYTLHPHQQSMGYSTINGAGHQQQYGVMHSDLLQQAANGLLANEAPDGPLMISSVGASGGVLLSLNGAAMHNGGSLNHSGQSGQQYSGTSVLVSSNGAPGGTVLGSPQPASQTPNSQRSSASTNSHSPTMHQHHHSSKKKRKCHSIQC